MKKLNNFYTDYADIRNKMLCEINNFFFDNPLEVVEVDAVNGASMTIVSFDYGKIDIDTINKDGVRNEIDDTIINFTDIALSDLSAIIDTINDWNESPEEYMKNELGWKEDK